MKGGALWLPPDRISAGSTPLASWPLLESGGEENGTLQSDKIAFNFDSVLLRERKQKGVTWEISKLGRPSVTVQALCSGFYGGKQIELWKPLMYIKPFVRSVTWKWCTETACLCLFSKALYRIRFDSLNRKESKTQKLNLSHLFLFSLCFLSIFASSKLSMTRSLSNHRKCNHTSFQTRRAHWLRESTSLQTQRYTATKPPLITHPSTGPSPKTTCLLQLIWGLCGEHF